MHQVIKQTDEEKMAMYMKMPKEKIASMLIEANKFIDANYPQNIASFDGIELVPMGLMDCGNKICDCSRKYQATAPFPCDGKCK